MNGTRPGVGLQPNAFGLYDMLGNASEWWRTSIWRDQTLCRLSGQ